MRQEVVKRLIRQSVTLLGLIVMVVIIFIVTNPGIASAHTLAPATQPTACKRVLNANYSESCVIPTIRPRVAPANTSQTSICTIFQ